MKFRGALTAFLYCFKRYYRALTDRVILISLLLGFSSGLPFALVAGTLKNWFTVSGISLQAISFVPLILIPYNLKFCWAPLIDRFIPPFMGRRRGWILICQLLLMVGIAAMSFFSPSHHPEVLVVLAVLVAFLSASQDIVIDAYRVDVLPASKRAWGAAMGVDGYRVAVLVSGSGALILAEHWGFQAVYLLMAVLISVGIIANLLAPEPELTIEAPRDFASSLILPLKDFLYRPRAIWILLFIACYRLGDTFTETMLQPFLIRKMQMSLTEIALLVKTSTFLGVVLGAMVGGAWIPKLGWYRALFIFGLLQSLANLVYLPLMWIGPNYTLLGSAMFIDNFSSGMSTTALVGLLMGLCNHRFSAFQFALLSAVMSIGRFISPLAGWTVETYGWEFYFLSSLVIAAPGLVLLSLLKSNIARMSGEVASQRASLVPAT